MIDPIPTAAPAKRIADAAKAFTKREPSPRRQVPNPEPPQKILRLKHAGLSPRHTSMQIDSKNDLSKGQIWSLNLECLLEDTRVPGGVFVLYGARGCGKTQLATQVLQTLAEQQSVACAKVGADLDMPRSSERVLVIDEVGEALMDKTGTRRLCHLVNARYESGRTTILIVATKDCKRPPSIPALIRSRMREQGGWVDLGGDDLRPQVRESLA